MYPRTFFNWLLPPLRPLERKILSAVEAKLSPSLAKLLSAQIRDINYGQRRQGGREVGLYVIHAGRVDPDESFKIPMAVREWRLARIRLTKGGSRSIATVHLADGYLASIEYDRPPSGSDTDDVTLGFEIFEMPSHAPKSSDSVPTLPDWLQLYAKRLGIAEIDPPLTPKDRAEIIERFESVLPADYMEFTTNCDGVQIGSLSLAGLRDAYETRANDAEYIVIGQVNGRGALAVRKPGPTTVFMNYEDGTITELGQSLRTAVEHAMAI